MDSVEMLWGMAKATNPSDDVTGHRPLQMISQIFVVNIFNMFTVHHGFIPLACWAFVFETPCNFTSLQPSRIPLNSGADLGCWTAAVLREKASLARADLLPDARWGMRLDWLMDIHCHCLQKPCQRPLLSNLCVFLGHASKWKEALSWSLIIRIYEDHLDSS